jgi:hypothetical protein
VTYPQDTQKGDPLHHPLGSSWALHLISTTLNSSAALRSNRRLEAALPPALRLRGG